MPRIFISHIHEDRVAAFHLITFLRAKLNIPPEELFLSSNKQIQLGSEWLAAINSIFQGCTVVIALFSEEAMKRQWVHFEAGGGFFNKRKSLIPICIGDLHPCDLGRPYSNILAGNLHDRSTGQHLVSSIWKALKPETAGLAQLEYAQDDPDLRILLEGLEEWRTTVSYRQTINA